MPHAGRRPVSSAQARGLDRALPSQDKEGREPGPEAFGPGAWHGVQPAQDGRTWKPATAVAGRAGRVYFFLEVFVVVFFGLPFGGFGEGDVANASTSAAVLNAS